MVKNQEVLIILGGNEVGMGEREDDNSTVPIKLPFFSVKEGVESVFLPIGEKDAPFF